MFHGSLRAIISGLCVTDSSMGRRNTNQALFSVLTKRQKYHYVIKKGPIGSRITYCIRNEEVVSQQSVVQQVGNDGLKTHRAPIRLQGGHPHKEWLVTGSETQKKVLINTNVPYGKQCHCALADRLPCPCSHNGGISYPGGQVSQQADVLVSTQSLWWPQCLLLKQIPLAPFQHDVLHP